MMNKFLHLPVWIILSILFTSPGFAAPDNDNLVAAIDITNFPYTNQQSSQQAGNEPAELLSKCFNDFTTKLISASVWYQYTATNNQTVTFDTLGSDYDTLLSVWQSSSHPLTEVDCNDDSGTYKQSHLSLAVETGNTYFINISGFRGATGNLIFNANSVNPLTNDNLANAIAITPDANLSYHNTQNAKDATNETNEVVASCDSDNQGSVWYQYTTTETQRVVFDTVSSDYNTILSVWTGNQHPLQEVACDKGDGGPSSQLSVEVTAGNTYYISVAAGKLGGGSLLPQTGLLTFNMAAPPSNDDVANAILVESIPYVNGQNTGGATLEKGELSPSCSPGSNASVWYLFAPSEDYANVTFSTAGSSYDTALSLWQGDAHPFEERACNDEVTLMTELVTELGGASQLTVPVAEDETLYIDVSSASGDTGNLILHVEEGQLDFAITSQPSGASIASCETATLSVDIERVTENTEISQPVNYQWYQGNSGDDKMLVAEIEDDGVFTTPPLKQTMNYWVRIANPTGAIDSETAIITVDKQSGNPDCEDIATISDNGTTDNDDNGETDNNGSDNSHISSDTNGVGIDVNGNPVSTTANFVGRVTTSPDEQEHLSSVTQTDEIFVTFTITVDPNHVGETADILMVGGYTQELITNFYMRDVSDWTLWNVDMANLEEAEVDNLLPESLDITVFEGSLDGLPGDFVVYVGYRLTNGSMFYIGEPITFTVE
jgi:hypothetical protein